MRQQLSIRDKLAAKKKKRMNELKRKQDMEMTQEWLNQKKELDEIKLSQVIINVIGCESHWMIVI